MRPHYMNRPNGSGPTDIRNPRGTPSPPLTLRGVLIGLTIFAVVVAILQVTT